MANYFLNVDTISRDKKCSLTGRSSYICGKRLHDSYNGKTYYNNRHDVEYYNVFLPWDAPDELKDIQTLCTRVDEAEVRKNARTARMFICSLPNELSIGERIRIVSEFINDNFTECGLCAIAAIHEGINKDDSTRNNPHVHIIVPTRPVGADGFCKKKDREHDNRKYIGIWREKWADVQNKAYERKGLDIRVSHERLEAQGIDREPTKYMKLSDWQKELRGERTATGDENRLIRKRNQERSRQAELQRDREAEIEIWR